MDGVAADRASHWDQVYAGNAGQPSWYEAHPALSLELIHELAVARNAPVIDVGGGSSTLTDALLARGFRDLTVLDISPEGLAVARRRLGSASRQVRWMCDDLLRWVPDRTYDLWHDRAVFHFLADPTEQLRYQRLVGEAVREGGGVIVGTFAPDGPPRCSGLPVVRYTPQQLITTIGPGLQLVASRREMHRTPGGAIQPFTWVAARRRSHCSES